MNNTTTHLSYFSKNEIDLYKFKSTTTTVAGRDLCKTYRISISLYYTNI